MRTPLEDLNNKQQEAVRATEGRIRVVAGAGSGKTRALAYRYAYLVNELGIDPANILCLTFTNKAAREMKTRIASLVPPGTTNDFVCTIHSFCLKFLREEIFRVGYPRTFKVIDEQDLHAIAKEVLEDAGIERKEKTVRDLLEDVKNYKVFYSQRYIQSLLLPEAGVSDDDKRIHVVQVILKQKKYLSLDFDDLIYFTEYILVKHPDVCGKWQKRFQYVMVDEAQDCNGNDWNIFTTLSKKYNNLFIVGDPDQAIYEWRGSKPGLFVGFEADKDIIMAENYRSTSTILDAANSIITNNKMRVEKNLFTHKTAGSIITHHHGQDEKEETDWVAKTIKHFIENGSSASDFAILYRASYLSRSMEQSLIRTGISYVVWGGIRFFEREEIKHALSYLRLIADGDDDMAFRRICNVPSRKIGKATLGKMATMAKEAHGSLYDAMRQGVSDGTFNEPAISDFVKLIEKCRSIIGGKTLSDLLNTVLEDSGLMRMYREDGEEERLENIEELINAVKIYEEDNKEENITLESYLQDIALYTDADYKKDNTRTKLMTIHQAKGLEFPYVFIIGASENIFPSQRTIRESKIKGLEEERRLMYVAVTRAERILFITESEGYCPQVRAVKIPSRFIREIKQHLYVTDGDMDPELWKSTEAFVKEEGDLSLYSVEFPLDASVIHPHFGRGKVTSVEDDYVTADFGEFGERRVKKNILQNQEKSKETIETFEKRINRVNELHKRRELLEASHLKEQKQEDAIRQSWDEYIKTLPPVEECFSYPYRMSNIIHDAEEYRLFFSFPNESLTRGEKNRKLESLEEGFRAFTKQQNIKLIPAIGSNCYLEAYSRAIDKYLEEQKALNKSENYDSPSLDESYSLGLNSCKTLSDCIFKLKEVDFCAVHECDMRCRYVRGSYLSCSKLDNFREKGIDCSNFAFPCIKATFNVQNVNSRGWSINCQDVFLLDEDGFLYIGESLCETMLPFRASSDHIIVHQGTQTDFCVIFPHLPNGVKPRTFLVFNNYDEYIAFPVRTKL